MFLWYQPKDYDLRRKGPSARNIESHFLGEIMVAIVGAAPAIAACLTNPACATGAAVIGFGGMMMAAKNAEQAKAPSQSMASPSSAPQDPKDECNQKYNNFYNELMKYDKKPTADLAQSITEIGKDYIANCKDADPKYSDRAENIDLDWLVSKRY